MSCSVYSVISLVSLHFAVFTLTCPCKYWGLDCSCLELSKWRLSVVVQLKEGGIKGARMVTAQQRGAYCTASGNEAPFHCATPRPFGNFLRKGGGLSVLSS